MLASTRDIQKPFAVVIGLDHINGIQTARILARHQVPVIAVAKDPQHYCCRTRVCERILFTDTTTEALISTLEALGPTLGEKAVLFPCTDVQVLLVSRHRQSLERWFHISLPAPEVVETLTDKVRFYTYAQETGAPIPRTFFLYNKADAEKAAQELTFPCILKPPLHSSPEWDKKSKQKAYLLSSAEEFLVAYDRLAALSDILITQECIEGPISNLYSCNCYFNANSEPVVTFVARKLRQWPPDTGDSSLGEECRNDAVLEETIRLFKSVQYRGLGYVEMKQDERTGKHFIIEPNIGRPTGRSAIAEAGGVELLYTMYCDALGWPLPPNREQQYGNAKWIYLGRDLQSAWFHWRRGQLTLKEWWRSLRGIKTDAIFSWTDLGPFLGDLQRAILLFLSTEERRKRDYSDPLT